MVRRIPVVSVILVVLVLAISAVPLIYLITVSFFTQASYYGSELRVTLSNLRVFALPAFVRSIEVSLATAAAGSILSLAVTIAAAYGRD